MVLYQGNARRSPGSCLCVLPLVPGIDFALKCDCATGGLHSDIARVQARVTPEGVFYLCPDIGDGRPRLRHAAFAAPPWVDPNPPPVVDYKVFLDQYVLTAASSLAVSLGEALDASQSAVMAASAPPAGVGTPVQARTAVSRNPVITASA